MNILNILHQDGHQVFKKTSDEYAGPCPFCGGTDRFIVQPAKGEAGRYWCRQCNRSGDLIQYLRDTKGMSYRGACSYLGQAPRRAHATAQPTITPSWEPRVAKQPAALWCEKAGAFLEYAQKCLAGKEGAEGRAFLRDRSLSDATIKTACLGWSPKDFYRSRVVWGLPHELSEKTGKPKKLWLPRGLVIPYHIGSKVVRLRVRRPQPGLKDRYRIVAGSDTRPLILGCTDKDKHQMWIIVESELDALLIHQEAGDLVGVVGLGNAQARPNTSAHERLAQAEMILLSLDSDRAGAKESWDWWRKHYKQATRWPCVAGKDPGEMAQSGIDIRSWVQAALISSEPIL